MLLIFASGSISLYSVLFLENATVAKTFFIEILSSGVGLVG
jgi:hypothetical protein